MQLNSFDCPSSNLTRHHHVTQNLLSIAHTTISLQFYNVAQILFSRSQIIWILQEFKTKSYKDFLCLQVLNFKIYLVSVLTVLLLFSTPPQLTFKLQI